MPKRALVALTVLLMAFPSVAALPGFETDPPDDGSGGDEPDPLIDIPDVPDPTLPNATALVPDYRREVPGSPARGVRITLEGSPLALVPGNAVRVLPVDASGKAAWPYSARVEVAVFFAQDAVTWDVGAPDPAENLDQAAWRATRTVTGAAGTTTPAAFTYPGLPAADRTMSLLWVRIHDPARPSDDLEAYYTWGRGLWSNLRLQGETWLDVTATPVFAN